MLKCNKKILSNTGSTITTFSYQKCSTTEWEYQVPLYPGQTKTVWAILDTLSIPNFFLSEIEVITVPTSATYTITIFQNGPNVTVSGTGNFNLSAVQMVGTLNGFFDFCFVSPSLVPGILTGLVTGQVLVPGIYNLYTNLNYQPTNGSFGTGSFTTSSIGSGPNFELFRTTPFSLNTWTFSVPSSYVSMTNFVSTATFTNKTINSLGLTPGVYNFVWGPPENYTEIVLQILSNITPTPTITSTNTPTPTPTVTNTPSITPTSTPASAPYLVSSGDTVLPPCEAKILTQSIFSSALEWFDVVVGVTTFYSDSSLTTPFDGNNLWYTNSTDSLTGYYQINNSGIAIDYGGPC